MGNPSHKIKREVFELEVPRRDLARRLQDDTARFHAPRIAPILEQACVEASSADRLHRIGRVEVDLGSIPANDFENELCKRLAMQLPLALREKIRAHERQHGAESALITSLLELFACFARTGTVPWWADVTREGLLEESIRDLLRAAPSELAQLLSELVREPEPLRRIPLAFKDPTLAELTALLSPWRAARALGLVPPALVQLLQHGKLDLALSASRCRDIAWQGVLLSAARPRTHQASSESAHALAVCEDTLVEIAVAMGVTYGGLLSILHRESSLPAVRALLAQAPIADLHGRDGRAAVVKGAPDRPIAWDELLAAIRSIAAQAPAGRAARWRSLEGALERTPAPLLEQALADGRLSAEILERCLSDLSGIHDLSASPGARAHLSRALRDAIARRGAEDRQRTEERVSDVDELYVHDAGLVLLWPFFRGFFERLGLLEEERWKSRASQHRAVAIVHSLASGDRAPAEYQLSLAKILCGLDVTDVIELGEPLSGAEAEACEELLTAVIAQAPILNDLSITAFRASFLVRRGMLAPQDGAFLLRVERETHDIVLDRLPWSFDWAALPWMKAPLRVEWR